MSADTPPAALMPIGVEQEGMDAYRAGVGESECPYTDTVDHPDYWQSSAGKRQTWVSGFLMAWRMALAVRGRAA